MIYTMKHFMWVEIVTNYVPPKILSFYLYFIIRKHQNFTFIKNNAQIIKHLNFNVLLKYFYRFSHHSANNLRVPFLISHYDSLNFHKKQMFIDEKISLSLLIIRSFGQTLILAPIIFHDSGRRSRRSSNHGTDV